ncbi:MAG: efflux RND transporter periplasmic adaptor subunit [Nannocystaceae bacterium]|nr:efflux RND transporter periplasmic adaptor subunit [bacterium]
MLAAFGALVLGCAAGADEGPPRPSPVADVELPAVRVQVARAQRRVLSIDASATGNLHAFKTATVAAEVAGRVKRRAVERGDSVEHKSTLFEIDTQNSRLALQQAKANASASQIDLDLAERELQRGEALMRGQDISKSSYDQLAHSRDSAKKRVELAKISQRQAAKSVADSRVRMPFDATVVRLHAEEGDYVGPGTPLATIADLSKMRLRVGLTAAEADAAQAKEGSPVEVTFSALGGLAVQGVMHDVDPLVDPASGTYTAEFWLDQPKGSPLREGMVGRVVLDSEADQPEVVIPRHSVVRHGRGVAVWVVQDVQEHRGVARRQPIVLGRHDATHTVVAEGLEAGAIVVTSGHFALADGLDVELDEAGS